MQQQQQLSKQQHGVCCQLQLAGVAAKLNVNKATWG
jgi:hypothetical protein